MLAWPTKLDCFRFYVVSAQVIKYSTPWTAPDPMGEGCLRKLLLWWVILLEEHQAFQWPSVVENLLVIIYILVILIIGHGAWMDVMRKSIEITGIWFLLKGACAPLQSQIYEPQTLDTEVSSLECNGWVCRGRWCEGAAPALGWGGIYEGLRMTVTKYHSVEPREDGMGNSGWGQECSVCDSVWILSNGSVECSRVAQPEEEILQCGFPTLELSTLDPMVVLGFVWRKYMCERAQFWSLTQAPKVLIAYDVG